MTGTPRKTGTPGNASHVLALVRSHLRGDDEHFQSVSLQIAADAARKGHHNVADDIKSLVADARASGGGIQKNASGSMRPEIRDLFVSRTPSFGFDRLVLDGDLQKRLRSALRENGPEPRARLAANGLDPRRRFLLVGPPGTGKTMTAQAFAKELDLPFHTIKLDRLITKFMGETSAKLRLVFDAVKDHRGVYFFDEFDALAAARNASDGDVGEARRILTSLLTMMEGDTGSSIVFSATNIPKILDVAMFRRFDAIFTYRNPTAAMVRATIEGSLPASFAENLAKMEWEIIGSCAMASGLSHSDLAQAAMDAAREAVLEKNGDITTETMLQAIKDHARADGHR